MGIKALKEYDGIEMKPLKEAAKALNLCEALPTKIKIGNSGPKLLLGFINAIDSIADDATDTIDEVAYNFYNAIPQEVFNDSKEDGVKEDESRPATTPKTSKPKKTAKVAKEDEVGTEAGTEAGATEASTEEITSECPTFKQGWDEKEEDCIECSKEYNNEYVACKAAVEAAAAAKPKKKKKKAAGKKAAGKRTRYGHMPGSMAAVIDDLVWAGTTRKDMVAALMAEPFNRDEKKATTKVAGHLLCLINDKKITIKEKKDGGICKADEEFAEGFNADNTVNAPTTK